MCARGAISRDWLGLEREAQDHGRPTQGQVRVASTGSWVLDLAAELASGPAGSSASLCRQPEGQPMMTDTVAAGPTEGKSSENWRTEKEEGVTAWGCIARAGSLGCARRSYGCPGPEAGSLRTAARSVLCPSAGCSWEAALRVLGQDVDPVMPCLSPGSPSLGPSPAPVPQGLFCLPKK